MDTQTAARLLSVAEHEVVEIRQHAGWWEARHHDMASHEETWRPVPGGELATDAPPETAEDDPEGPEGPGVDTDGDRVPEGNAAQVLDWVGDDKDKAKAALEAEQHRDKPRSTLVAALEKLAG